ncbi:hypothetical protein JTE90_023375 [Oedothorax gibbosus]|uniref:Uncharacterized protein n=1 Tax=Oedothorax gibbosus TaxID=931172 RepID=A0AAV6V1J7_9ARAC|nr:hypothetical protein JTE90_023375 [Oedothorax gibbosus]
MATDPTMRVIFLSRRMVTVMNVKADRMVLNDRRAILKSHVSEINIELILLSGLDVPGDLKIRLGTSNLEEKYKTFFGKYGYF